jgi:hypothetical protein
MTILNEIQSVIEGYKAKNKAIDYIVVDEHELKAAMSLMDDVTSVDCPDNPTKLFGYPCTLRNDEFHRFTVQSKTK